jgi:hypothetical protein
MRSQVWVARIFGILACLFGVFVVVVLFQVPEPVVWLYVFGGIFGLCAVATGGWMLVNASQIARLRAIATPDELRIVAHAGRAMGLTRKLAEAVIPWAEVQGVAGSSTFNQTRSGGVQTNYILYTNRGDFTLDVRLWANVAGLIREVCARSGRKPGEIAPERSAALAGLRTGERRSASRTRIFGWILAIACTAMLAIVGIAGLNGDSSTSLIRFAIYLAMGIGVGISMIRFRRK